MERKCQLRSTNAKFYQSASDYFIVYNIIVMKEEQIQALFAKSILQRA